MRRRVYDKIILRKKMQKRSRIKQMMRKNNNNEHHKKPCRIPSGDTRKFFRTILIMIKKAFEE